MALWAWQEATHATNDQVHGDSRLGGSIKGCDHFGIDQGVHLDRDRRCGAGSCLLCEALNAPLDLAA